MPHTNDLSVETQPDPWNVAFLEGCINTFNAGRTGFRDYLPLALFQRGEEGQLEAGLYGFTWGGCCEVKLLWVDEGLRGQGLGTKLLNAAETEAHARGCAQVILDTHSFQAPGFYQKLGYEVVGVIEGYPRGHQKVFLSKRLTQSN